MFIVCTYVYMQLDRLPISSDASLPFPASPPPTLPVSRSPGRSPVHPRVIRGLKYQLRPGCSCLAVVGLRGRRLEIYIHLWCWRISAPLSAPPPPCLVPSRPRASHPPSLSSKQRDPNPNNNSSIKKQFCKRRMESLICRCFLSY